MHHLLATHALHARCIPTSHAARRLFTPASYVQKCKTHEAGLFQWQVHERRAGSLHAVRSCRMGPSQARCFDERENLGGKYGWKFVIDVHGRKRVHYFLACN